MLSKCKKKHIHSTSVYYISVKVLKPSLRYRSAYGNV